MAKSHFTVVRNQGYGGGEFNTRERHNERKNESYHNGDIIVDRAHLNVHYHQNFRADGTPETYEETYKRLLADGKISEKWLKPDSKIFAELVFDVNSEYFEERGGYDYARTFFDEAYRLAMKEVGGEDFILSAVLHADERNKVLSETLGRDVYHFHLHIVYVPVVEKREYFRQKKGEPESERKLKAVYTQVSHAKKWPLRVPVERDGKTIIVNSYSLLQDRYFEHMKAAGFDGFERGERGSTAEHLDVLDYKIQQDKKRAAELDNEISEKGKTLAEKDKQIATKDKKLERYKNADADIGFVDTVGNRRDVLGRVILTDKEAKDLKKLAKEGVASRGEIYNLQYKVVRSNGDCKQAEKERDEWKGYHQTLHKKVKHYLDAARHSPLAAERMITEIMNNPPERNQPQRTKQRIKNTNYER